MSICVVCGAYNCILCIVLNVCVVYYVNVLYIDVACGADVYGNKGQPDHTGRVPAR